MSVETNGTDASAAHNAHPSGRASGDEPEPEPEPRIAGENHLNNGAHQKAAGSAAAPPQLTVSTTSPEPTEHSYVETSTPNGHNSGETAGKPQNNQNLEPNAANVSSTAAADLGTADAFNPGSADDISQNTVAATAESSVSNNQDGRSTPQRSHARQASTFSITSTSATVDNSNIFKTAFELILASKEAKKNEALKVAVEKALTSVKDSNSRDPHLIFSALKVVCESSNADLKAKAIDLFAKLFDYGQFDDENDKVELTDNSVDVIASCFDGEGTDPEVELQVIRALMHSLLLMPCHGASLLKAVRQIYNVFIFSLSARNQAVAQGTLTQVIAAIFQRIRDSGIMKKHKSGSLTNIRSSSFLKENADLPDTPAPEERLTLENLERLNNDTFDSLRVDEANRANTSDEDLVVKDTFLIFRAMCKLSVKEIESQTLDMRSHSVRSKLLSLHIIHTILKDHIDIFLSRDVVLLSSNANEQTRLINAVRQYLCLALSRNAASSIAPVFELSLEIFWLIVSNLRSEFKREIPVFFDEIYFPVSEMKTSTPHQKRYLLSIIERLCNDSRCIIEFYLNYDCDSSMPNICERVIDYLTKLSLARVDTTPQQKAAYRENRKKGVSVYDVGKTSNLTSATMSSRPPEPDVYNHFPLEYALKMTSISCSVAFLRSLYSWAQKGITLNSRAGATSGSLPIGRNRSSTVHSETSTNNGSRNPSFVNPGDFSAETDDPEQFQSLKQRKKTFLEGVKQFNQKAKKGIQYFVENGFIKSDDPQSIAAFLLETDGLDKAVIGEYLGEGDERNVAIMHAFVDMMAFKGLNFVDAMRNFLQSFRLPGEAQKIDRFMLKFAERYVNDNPNIFANADSAYILSYSVILLNTDLHSPQVKNRMTFESFVMNNSGIDDGKDLPRELLEAIYNEIATNEIKLQSEQHAALLAGELTNVQSSGFFGGRDVNKEAYIHASKEMSTKTEKLVRNLGKRAKGDENSVFYAASNVFHVKSIFDTLWMSILAGLTPPFKEYEEDDITRTCLEGIKLAIKIACMFDLDYARTSFVGALIQFMNLHNYEEMSPKNVEAIHILLEVAVSEGNYLKTTWISILTAISQLERLQLIAQGIDQDSIPDVAIAKLVNRHSHESNTRHSTSFFSFGAYPTASQTAANKFHNQHLNPAVAALLTATDLEVAVDKVYTNSANLNGESIVEFIKALSEVSLEEIESSGQSANPRIFSLQKIVDICYYNMSRIRVEWTHLWSIMGATFNKVGCHSNLNVVFFALDSLRQLSVRFFEIEELSHFKFQKEFLKPFEYIINNNESLEIKDMVLECIDNMVLAKSDKIKSGWKTIFGVLAVAAKENKESLVHKSFKLANVVTKKYLEEVKAQDAFGDLVLCFTELCKNGRFQKINLLSLEVLQKLINQLAVSGLEQTDDKQEVLEKTWLPILFGFHNVIMTGDELEVRANALNHLFDILLEYGENFQIDFWQKVCKQLLFPIFDVLNRKWELNALEDTNDNFSVWLSTTLIQALRNMIGLFTHYFESLRVMLGEYLALLTSCICQENDTIARIGRSCLHTLLIDNAQKFNHKEWELIVESFNELFDLTTAKELFTFDPLYKQVNGDGDNESIGSVNDEQVDEVAETSTSIDDQLKKTQDKSSIVIKCVLQLLMIETLSELFENEIFYEQVPFEHLHQLAQLLDRSYQFAKKFNDNYDLRVRLWNSGIIERLPNLLKQETSSAAVYINIMFKMYCDPDKTDEEARGHLIESLVPLCNSIMLRYSEFDEVNQQRNVATWKPVIVEIYQGYVELDDKDFEKYTPTIYITTLRLFSKSLSTELRHAVRSYLQRVGDTYIK